MACLLYATNEEYRSGACIDLTPGSMSQWPGLHKGSRCYIVEYDGDLVNEIQSQLLQFEPCHECNTFFVDSMAPNMPSQRSRRSCMNCTQRTVSSRVRKASWNVGTSALVAVADMEDLRMHVESALASIHFVSSNSRIESCQRGVHHIPLAITNQNVKHKCCVSSRHLRLPARKMNTRMQCQRRSSR